MSHTGDLEPEATTGLLSQQVPMWGSTEAEGMGDTLSPVLVLQNGGRSARWFSG